MEQRDGAIRLAELTRYVLDELSDAERADLERRVAASPEAQTRLEAVRAGHAAALERLDVANDSARILERLEAAEETKKVAWWKFAIPMFAAAAAAIALVPLTSDPTGPTTRTKGVTRPALEMYVNGPAGPQLAADGARLGEGDAIQFRYDAAGHPFVFVVSVDGRGTISPLYPDLPTTSIEVEPSGKHVLDGSIILDDAVGPERIYAVFSKRPLTYADLENEIREARENGTDITTLQQIGLQREDVAETSVLIIKE